MYYCLSETSDILLVTEYKNLAITPHQFTMLSSGAYLGSKLKSIDILLSCPATDMLFMKINATLLSSAADEKLFSALNGR